MPVRLAREEGQGDPWPHAAYLHVWGHEFEGRVRALRWLPPCGGPVPGDGARSRGRAVPTSGHRRCLTWWASYGPSSYLCRNECSPVLPPGRQSWCSYSEDSRCAAAVKARKLRGMEGRTEVSKGSSGASQAARAQRAGRARPGVELSHPFLLHSLFQELPAPITAQTQNSEPL